MEKMPLPLANPPAQSCALGHLPVIDRAAHGYDAPAPLRLWHLASLDAPTVAVVWSLAFAWAAGLHLPAWVPVLLALTTWSVYIGDRLLDAYAGLRSNALDRLRERHLFHWRHRLVLAPAAFGAAAASAAIILTLMPDLLRRHDSVLAAAALAYFSGVHSRRKPPSWLAPLLSKEFLVGVLFTAGCALPTLSQMPISFGTVRQVAPLFAAIAFLAALAWLNCHAIESWESRKTGSRIFAEGCFIGAAGLALSVAIAPIHFRIAALLVAGAAAAFLIALLDCRRRHFTSVALRAAADLVLLTPIFLLAR